MSASITLWTHAVHHPAFRCGGWAFVRVFEGSRTGAAGGERNTELDRMALTGLASALVDLPPSVPIRVYTTSAALAAFAGVFSEGSTDGARPDQDLDLWARILTASKGRRLELIHAPLKPATPSAFVAAWADLAMDKAKMGGAFTAAIPKPNLLKAAGVEAS